MRMIDAVSETYRCSWDAALNLPCMEFLNVYSYMLAKTRTQNAMMKAQYDQMKARYRRH